MLRACPRESWRRQQASGLRSKLLLVCIVLICTPARAELLAWDGTLSLDFFTADPLLGHWELAGSHSLLSARVPPSLGAVRVAGGISDIATALVTDPETVGNSIAAIQLAGSLGTGTLSPLPPLPFGQQLVWRQIPVFGGVRLCLVTPDCADPVPVVSLYQGPADAVGVGGILAGTLPSSTRISIQAAPWTLGTASLPLETSAGGTATAFAFGFVHGPASATGTTGASGGELQLVTPMATSSMGTPAVSGFGRLRIRFAPEPAGLTALASGLLTLIALARRRSRHSEGPCTTVSTRAENDSSP